MPTCKQHGTNLFFPPRDTGAKSRVGNIRHSEGGKGNKQWGEHGKHTTAYYILHTTYYYVPNMTNVLVASVAQCQFNCEVHGPVPLHGSHGILTVEPSCQTALQYFSSGACTASRRGPHAISTVSEWICLGEFWWNRMLSEKPLSCLCIYNPWA